MADRHIVKEPQPIESAMRISPTRRNCIAAWNLIAFSAFIFMADFQAWPDEWTETGELNFGRNSVALVKLTDGKVLAVGGTHENVPAEIYDPTTGAWSATATPGGNFLNPGALLLPSGKVLVCGGQRGQGSSFSSTYTDASEIYDPETGQWHSTGSMNQKREYHGLVLLARPAFRSMH